MVLIGYIVAWGSVAAIIASLVADIIREGR